MRQQQQVTLVLVAPEPAMVPHSTGHAASGLPLLLPTLPTQPEDVPEVLPQLTTWLISGNTSKAKAFPKTAQSYCLHHGDRILPNPIQKVG